MSGSSDQRLSIRLSFDGAQEARAQLEQLGQVGDTAMRKLESGGQAAGRGVASVAEAGNVLRAGLGQINGDLAATQRQFENLANSTLALTSALRSGAGLAGTIGLVVTAAAAGYEIFKNWDSISGAFGKSVDSLTGRFRDNATELNKVNDVLREFSRLSETAAQAGVRSQIRSLEALATAGQASREALAGEVTNIQGEIDRRVGLTEGRLRAARTGPGGAALSEESERILQMEIDRVRERAASNPEVVRLQGEIAQRQGAVRELDGRLTWLRAQIAGLNEATGSLLNTPPPGGGGGGGGSSSGGGRATRQEVTEAEREYQRLVQQGVQLTTTAATEQERYAEQVRALSAALGAARITQEQYNTAVAALDPAARAAREAQEQAARHAEQFARRSRDALAMIGETAMDRIGTGLVNAFVAGGKAALDFQSLMKGVIASIAADLLKLAVVTPITNSIFGTARPTLYGAMQGTGGQSGGMAGQAGQAAQSLGGNSGGGMFGGAFAGAGSFLSAPLYSSGGGFFPSAAPTAAGGAVTSQAIGAPSGVAGPSQGIGPTTIIPAQAGAGSSMSIGQGLGAGAAGFGLGMAGGSISGSLRGTADPTAGSAIGATLGTAAGFALIPVLGPAGPIIGGAVGGAIGGLFGPTKKGMAARSGGDVFLGTDANGQLVITGARGKRFDEGAARAEVQAQLNAINAQVGARGLSFAGAGQSAVGFGQASGSPRELSMTGLVGQLRSDNANQMTAFGTLAGRGGNLEQALQAADFVTQIFEPLGQAEKKTSNFTDAMEALTKAYDEAITKAKDLGLSEANLQAQRAERAAKLEADRARDLDIIDRTLGARRATLAGDTRGASLTQFDLRAEAENRAFRDQLRNLGFDEAGQDFARRMVEIEQLVADERLAVMRQFDDQMRGISQGLLEQLTLGDLGGLAPEARFGAGLSLLNNAQGALADGATVQELAEFSRVAQNVLPIAKDFLGISSNYAELVADVSRTLRTAAPGSDPANLGAILEASLNGSDRVEMAILSTGGAQTTVLQTVLSELKRLTTQNEALLARQAAA